MHRIPWLLLALLGAWTGAVHAAALGEAVGRLSVDLGGDWEFKVDSRDEGRDQRWFAPGVAFDRTLHVPGAWNVQGVRFPSDAELRDYEQARLAEQKSLNQLGILGVQKESDRLFSVYPGPGWYRRAVTIPAAWDGKVPWLVFAGVHRDAEVWVAGKPAARHRSYLTPFRVNLAEFAHAGETIPVVVRVDARRDRSVDPLMGCLDTLDFLYVTWGGIHRPVWLEATESTRLEEVFVVPHLPEATAEVRVAVARGPSEDLALKVEITDASGIIVASAEETLVSDAKGGTVNARLPEVRLWSPQTPYLYEARVRLQSAKTGKVLDTRHVRFGMREFAVAGGKFLLNGRPIFLRGYGDDAIFPKTIAPPVEKEEFRRRLAAAKEYGFNYVRHHSWTPPEEYLQAADELGMMLQPEFPFAYRWDLPTSPEAKRAALEQWEAVIRLSRNHPSIVTWCMGNELYDSFDLAPEMYRIAKRLDPTRPVIDSDGCNLRHQGRETLDFLVVQFGEGHSIGYQDGKYALPEGLAKPVIAHEMGYFVTLPDLNQFDLFQNGLKPYWLSQTRDLVAQKGRAAVYPAWLAASYRLQAASLKSNQEAARRSRLSGTSVWLFQDYPNCAEGVVDMFHRPKGVSAEEFRRFNAPTVLLLDAARRNWRGGETASFTFLVSRYEDEGTENAVLRWKLTQGTTVIASGVREGLRVRSDGVQELEVAKVELPKVSVAERLGLSVELVDANGTTRNAWDLWLFPNKASEAVAGRVRSAGFATLGKRYPGAIEITTNPDPQSIDLVVATRLGPDLLAYLRRGGRVWLLEPELVFAVEKTNFRLSSWDGGGPSGTTFDPHHPALRGMPSAGWCDLQFYPLIQGSKSVLLDPLGGAIQPLVRCIDRPTRLAERAYLFEAAVGQGKLLVSGFNFAQALDADDPGAVFLFDHLLRYALGTEFQPKAEVAESALSSPATHDR